MNKKSFVRLISGSFQLSLLFCLAVVLSGTLTRAQEKPRKALPADIAERRKLMLERSGGFITRESGPVLLYVNAQSRFSGEQVSAGIAEISQITRLPHRLESMGKESSDWLATAGDALAPGPEKVAFAVILADDPALPAALVAPQDGWGILNVHALSGKKKPSAEVLEARFRRQLWRVTTWTLGGGSSAMASAMTPAFSAEELDGIGRATPPDQLGRIMETARLRGMKPSAMVAYRQAVQEGWAPPPTNDVQRKIWEEHKNKQ